MIQGIEPPKDAEGREIPLNTKVLYKQDGKRFEVESFDYWHKYNDWFVRSRNEGIVSTIAADSVLLFPADSWEQLEYDIYHLVMGEYLDDPEGDVKDVISRAKALAEREKKC